MTTHRSQTLTVVLITHNNAETLSKCLESVQWADELIAIDLGSTDNTINILKKFLVTTYFHPSCDTIEHQQFLLDNATKDWILWIKPDEVMPEMLRHEIDGALMNTASVNGYLIYTKYLWEGETFPIDNYTSALRLFRRKVGHPIDEIGVAGFSVNEPIDALSNTLNKTLPNDLNQLLPFAHQQAYHKALQCLSANTPNLSKPGLVGLVIKPTATFLADAIGKGNLFKGASGLKKSWLKSYTRVLEAEQKAKLTEETLQIIS